MSSWSPWRGEIRCVRALTRPQRMDRDVDSSLAQSVAALRSSPGQCEADDQAGSRESDHR